VRKGRCRELEWHTDQLVFKLSDDSCDQPREKTVLHDKHETARIGVQTLLREEDAHCNAHPIPSFDALAPGVSNTQEENMTGYTSRERID
jgi:hypothetical protein